MRVILIFAGILVYFSLIYARSSCLGWYNPGKLGLLNRTGDIIISAEYDEILSTFNDVFIAKRAPAITA